MRNQPSIAPIAVKAIQDAVARSVDFDALQRITETIRLPGVAAAAARLSVADVAKTLDLDAITEANRRVIESIAAGDVVRELTETYETTIRDLSRPVAAVQISKLLADIDWAGLISPDWLPPNIGDADLAAVAAICLDEGLPLAWVPRAEIVKALLSAGSRDERQEILLARRADILDDCEAALGEIAHEWAVECRNAIAADRADLPQPAQSHAAGIIDSIVLAFLGEHGRAEAKKRAEAPVDDLPLSVAIEHFALRPLFLCFTRWYPGNADPIPEHFARHATAHAVGQADVFTPINALVAIMLATSLTVQFSDSV
jgi:hypothetical protein